MSKVKVLFVCLGNICRSPLAEGIFRQRVEERGLSEYFLIDSCGTASYHIGETPDERSMANAEKNGVKYTHRGRQFKKDDFKRFDYIFPMDASNKMNIMEFHPGEAKATVEMMRAYDSTQSGADVPDPYYGGEQGFQNVFDILDESVNNLLDHLVKEHQLA